MIFCPLPLRPQPFTQDAPFSPIDMAGPPRPNPLLLSFYPIFFLNTAVSYPPLHGPSLHSPFCCPPSRIQVFLPFLDLTQKALFERIQERANTRFSLCNLIATVTPASNFFLIFPVWTCLAIVFGPTRPLVRDFIS